MISACCHSGGVQPRQRDRRSFDSPQRVGGRISVVSGRVLQPPQSQERLGGSLAGRVRTRSFHPSGSRSDNRLVVRSDQQRCARAASKVVQSMLSRLERDVETYASLIQAFLKTDRSWEALEVLRDMRRHRVAPNLAICTSYIQFHCRTDDLEAAQRVFDKMKRHRITPIQTTYRILIEAFSQASRLHRALQLFDEMKQVGVVPDCWTYGLLIKVCARTDHLARAITLFREREKVHTAALPLCLSVLSALLAACAQAHDLPTFVHVLGYMRREKVASDEMTDLVIEYARKIFVRKQRSGEQVGESGDLFV